MCGKQNLLRPFLSGKVELLLSPRFNAVLPYRGLCFKICGLARLGRPRIKHEYTNGEPSHSCIRGSRWTAQNLKGLLEESCAQTFEVSRERPLGGDVTALGQAAVR